MLLSGAVLARIYSESERGGKKPVNLKEPYQSYTAHLRALEEQSRTSRSSRAAPASPASRSAAAMTDGGVAASGCCPVGGPHALVTVPSEVPLVPAEKTKFDLLVEVADQNYDRVIVCVAAAQPCAGAARGCRAESRPCAPRAGRTSDRMAI